MTRCEGPLAKHRETGGAVPDGAIVSDPTRVFGLICGVDSPRLQEEHHVSNLSDHCAVGKLQVIFWVPITATCHSEEKGFWDRCQCEFSCCLGSEQD